MENKPNDKIKDVAEKMAMILWRIVQGGSCGGPGDCEIPAWLHDAAIEAHDELRRIR